MDVIYTFVSLFAFAFMEWTNNTELCVGMIYVMYFIFSCDSKFNVFMRVYEYICQLTVSSLVKALTAHISSTNELRKTVVHLQLNT